MTGFTGFDAQRRPFAACSDCGVLPFELPLRDMNGEARALLRKHNGDQHKGRAVPEIVPRGDLGLVDWGE